MNTSLLALEPLGSSSLLLEHWSPVPGHMLPPTYSVVTGHGFCVISPTANTPDPTSAEKLGV